MADCVVLDLRISIREKGVFAVFHPDAGDLFNVCSDLKRVCWTLYKPDIRLEKNVSAHSDTHIADGLVGVWVIAHVSANQH
jgi:hypothetical protein